MQTALWKKSNASLILLSIVALAGCTPPPEACESSAIDKREHVSRFDIGEDIAYPVDQPAQVRINVKDIPILGVMLKEDPVTLPVDYDPDAPEAGSLEDTPDNSMVIVLTGPEPAQLIGPPKPYLPMDEQIQVQAQKVDEFEENAEKLEIDIRKKKAYEKGLQVMDQL